MVLKWTLLWTLLWTLNIFLTSIANDLMHNTPNILTECYPSPVVMLEAGSEIFQMLFYRNWLGISILTQYLIKYIFLLLIIYLYQSINIYFMNTFFLYTTENVFSYLIYNYLLNNAVLHFPSRQM